jgi:uncharacterized phage infection (PIP) family protein YhgE
MALRSTRSRTKKTTGTPPQEGVSDSPATVIEIPTVEMVDGGETTQQPTEGVAADTKENEVTETAYENDTEAFGDVDTVDPEVDVVETDGGEKPAKAAKEKKEPARPPVPEGYITPVDFAKKLTERLEAEGATHRNGNPVTKDDPIKPQTIYSFLRNGAKGDHALKSYTDGGRENLLKLDEANAWWDAKAERVKASAANAAAKKAAAANKATAKDVSDGDTASSEEVIEAE